MKRFYTAVMLVLVGSVAYTAHADLPRRAFIGLQLIEVTDSMAALNGLSEISGVGIAGLAEGGSAKEMGLQKGDIVLKANGRSIDGVEDFSGYVGQFQAGDAISLEVARGGSVITLGGTMKGFPRETSPHAEVIYDEFPFDGGYVRTIIHRPLKEGKHPVLFFIPGYTCISVDNMSQDHPYQKLLDRFSEQGFVVVKTEKAGMGDGRSNTPCASMDLMSEVALFTESYNRLNEYDFMDLENVFVFGHSMGGVQAPLMNYQMAPKGMIVSGTVARPWFEYFIEQTRTQRLLTGQDYLANEAGHGQSIRFYYQFLIEKKSPRQLQEDPEMADFLNRFWQYEEGGFMNGRHYSFWHQLQDTKLFTAWSQTKSHVLSLHGEQDFVAFNAWDHELIADIVNHYNPGKGTYVLVPNLDHSFTYVENMAHAVEKYRDGAYRRENFNYQFVDLVVDWMKGVVSK